MKKGFLFAAFAVVIAVLLVFIAAPIVNDKMAEKTAKELADLPLPHNTALVESVCQAGKLVGNGNGMQYFGAILIQSECSLDELKAYYNKWNCVVENQTNAEIEIVEHGKLAFQTDIEGNNYYIVYSWGNNNTIFHELDFRGH